MWLLWLFFPDWILWNPLRAFCVHNRYYIYQFCNLNPGKYFTLVGKEFFISCPGKRRIPAQCSHCAPRHDKERHSIQIIVAGHIYGCVRIAVSVINHVTSSAVKHRVSETVLLLAISLCIALTWLQQWQLYVFWGQKEWNTEDSSPLGCSLVLSGR